VDSKCNPGGRHHSCGHERGRGHGPSSFWMHDPKLIFKQTGLKKGDSFLDLGCGTGDYALYAAAIVGEDGAVYAVDIWQELITNLITAADKQGLDNLIGISADITAPLPLKDRCIDVCFIATVIHTLDKDKAIGPLLAEIRRVLKPGGKLVVIECKKQDMPFGPPKHIRFTAEETESLVIPCGFKKTGFTDLGYNYLIQFRLRG